MAPASSFHRAAVLPFAVALYPQLWFVNREVGIAVATTNRPEAVIRLQAVESAAIAMATSVIFAVVVAAAARSASGWLPPWTGPLFRPSNGAVAVFVVVSFAFWAIVIALPPMALPPGWSDVLGLLFSWPLLVLYVGMVFLGNAFFGEPSMPVQFAVVGVGVALSAVWLFLASGWIAARVVPGDRAVETR